MLKELGYADRTKQPYSNVGLLVSNWADGSSTQGTCSLVGRNDILTAGHCVYKPSRGGWAESFELYFGADYNNITGRFESIPTTLIYTNTNWLVKAWPAELYADNNHDQITHTETSYDLAVIGIDTPVGDELGSLGVKTLEDNNLYTNWIVQSIGYPSGSAGMMLQTVSVERNSNAPGVLGSNFTLMGPGSSGGPLLDGNYVVGVLSNGIGNYGYWADVSLFLNSSDISDFISSNDSLLNATPTDIALTLSNGSLYGSKPSYPHSFTRLRGSVEENALGAVVGTLSTTDPDSGDVHSYSLSGVGSELFEVDSSNNLKLKDGVSTDYETQSSYTLTVKSTDSGGLSRSEGFIVNVSDVVEGDAPTDIALTLENGSVYGSKVSYSYPFTYLRGSVEENALGAVVGTLSTTDPDSGDVHSYSLSGVGSELFEVDSSNNLKLKDGVSTDYETQSSYTLTVKSTDSGGLSYGETFTVNVSDIEEVLYGTLGNDVLDGFPTGYTGIDGGDGVDTVNYELESKNASFALSSSSSSSTYSSKSGGASGSSSSNLDLTITATTTTTSTTYSSKYGNQTSTSTSTESETLSNIERLYFTDKAYALDLDGNAGIAAKVIIATFGASDLSTYMKAALGIVDGGTTFDELCDLVISGGYIESSAGGSDMSSFVEYVYGNVVGRELNAFESAMMDNISNGGSTKAELLKLAVRTDDVVSQITTNSIDLIGVAGSSDGEKLVISFDV